MASEPAAIMSIGDLAEYLRISKSTLYKLAQEGGLPGQKVGRRWRFHKGAIDDWLGQHPEHLGGRNSGSTNAEGREE